jgi:hypothetical protein
MPSKPPLAVTVVVWLDDPGRRSIRLDATLHAGPPSSTVPVGNPLPHAANIAALEADRACTELIHRVALAAGWSSAVRLVPD